MAQPNIGELINVILELSKDHERAEAFRRDPEGYLSRIGVSDELRQLMSSGSDAVESTIRGGAEPTVAIIVVIVVIVIHIGGGGGGKPPKKPT